MTLDEENATKENTDGGLTRGCGGRHFWLQTGEQVRDGETIARSRGLFIALSAQQNKKRRQISH